MRGADLSSRGLRQVLLSRGTSDRLGRGVRAPRHFRAISRAPGQEPLTRTTIAALMFGFWVLGLVQAGLLARMPLPLGATAPVLVTVLVLAHALGPVPGAMFGAWAGLVLDLTPPAAGPVGGWALILTVAGLAMGYVQEARQPGPWLSIALVGVGAASAVGMRAMLLWFAGHSPAAAATLLVALCAGGTAVLLAPMGLVVAQLVATGRQPLPRWKRAGLPAPARLSNEAETWQMTAEDPTAPPEPMCKVPR